MNFLESSVTVPFVLRIVVPNVPNETTEGGIRVPSVCGGDLRAWCVSPLVALWSNSFQDTALCQNVSDYLY